jgi:hypothetical protein
VCGFKELGFKSSSLSLKMETSSSLIDSTFKTDYLLSSSSRLASSMTLKEEESDEL